MFLNVIFPTTVPAVCPFWDMDWFRDGLLYVDMLTLQFVYSVLNPTLLYITY